jgi:ligand-binding sensor domain-containing protein
MRSSIILTFLVLIISNIHAQIGVGEWREHLPYSKCISLAEDGQGKIYAATTFSLFYYDQDDYTINKINSINLLSDIGVSTIAYNKSNKTLVIGYENGNIDLLKNNRVENMPDIYKKQIIGSKKINSIYTHDNFAYLCTDFGIVVVDIMRKEIKDTYYIGPNAQAIKVNQLLTHQDTFYAATEMGIFKADINNPNLVNFQNWSPVTTIPNPTQEFSCLTLYKDELIAAYKGASFNTDTLYIHRNNQWSIHLPYINGPITVLKGMGDSLIIGEEFGYKIFYQQYTDSFVAFDYNQNNSGQIMPRPNDIIRDKNNTLWIADDIYSLVKNPREWLYEFIQPSGPFSKEVWDMSVENQSLWVASGGYQSTGSNSYVRKGIYRYEENEWNSWNAENASFLDSIDDIVSIAVNPQNSKEVYLGTWGQGLIKMYDGQFSKAYSPDNSSLSEASNRPGFVGIPGLFFDLDGNLWVSNTANSNGLSRLSPDGKWKAYSLSPYISEDMTGELLVDDFNQIWMIVQRGRGLMVYNDNLTESPNDDQKRLLNSSPGNGGLPSSTIYSIAKDKDGEVWVGTAKGVAVFYAPELVFSGNEFDAQQIYVEQEGISQYLLESEEVSAVAVDGANRKWLGTRNSGVFLMSDDGTEQIHHFNTTNSPILSNNILSIAIDQQSGEVYFGTERGIISYRSDASEGKEYHDSVKVFPNPVRPEYQGNITISGLVSNAQVKITDISGNLILETTANGGTAVWNGKTLMGDRVGTGVYLVFSTNDDGTQTMVSKILFIN